jgi:DNA-binding NtrC family response regulator
MVEQALLSAKGNKSAAARLLGIHRKMLERMVKSDSSPPSAESDDEPVSDRIRPA